MSDSKYSQCILRHVDDSRSHIKLGAIAEVKYNEFLKSKDGNSDLDADQVELKVDLGNGSRLDIIKVDALTPCSDCISVYLTPECKYPERHCTYCYKYTEGDLCCSILSHKRDPKKFIELLEITKANLQLLDLRIFRLKFGWDKLCFPDMKYLGKIFAENIQSVCIGAYVPELQDYKLGVTTERSEIFRKMHQVVHSSSIDRIFKHRVDSDIEIPRINSWNDMHSKITYRSGRLEDRHRDRSLQVVRLDELRLCIDMQFKTHEFLYLVELTHLHIKLPVQLCRIIIKLCRDWSD